MHRYTLSLAIGFELIAACSSRDTGRTTTSLTIGPATYTHPGFSAGPALFTDATGHLLEERRTEPFGEALDAIVGGVFGPPDFAARDLNELGKRSDPATAWSDHGARWLASEEARWLAPDPPVAAPAPKFMLAPWALHPYQYVAQNPVAYWDPDGREPRSMPLALPALDDLHMLDHQIERNVPAGPAREAALHLLRSDATIDQFTALQLASGRLSVGYLEDVRHASDEAETLQGWGLSAATYSVYELPIIGKILVPNMAGGTVTCGVILGYRFQSVGYWEQMLRHETNHHVNHDEGGDSFTRYKGEFRAWWVDGSGPADPDQRAGWIKNKILTTYPHLRQEAADKAEFDRQVEAYKRPEGNLDNYWGDH